MLLNTLLLGAEAEALHLSLVQDELVGECVHQFHVHVSEAVHVEVLDALVVMELFTSVFTVAHLAQDLDFRTVYFYMIV